MLKRRLAKVSRAREREAYAARGLNPSTASMQTTEEAVEEDEQEGSDDEEVVSGYIACGGDGDKGESSAAAPDVGTSLGPMPLAPWSSLVASTTT